MTREEQLAAAWYEAHQEVRTYLEPALGADQARVSASVACALWFQNAADGGNPATGPYGHLFAAAFYTAQQVAQGLATLDQVAMDKRIGIDRTLLPYQLSKIHTDIWKTAQLLHWDRKTVHRVSIGLSLVWPVSDSGWAPLGTRELSPLVLPLFRRAVETLTHHTCLDCAICTEGAVRWEDADRATEQWFTGRRLAKEEAACPTEERSPSP